MSKFRYIKEVKLSLIDFCIDLFLCKFAKYMYKNMLGKNINQSLRIKKIVN